MQANENTNQETGLEMAVIGMSGRFPGAGNLDEFWENLKNGIESIHFFSGDELDEWGVPPQLQENPHYVGAEGVLADMDYFDAAFFGYTPAEAEMMDPQMRIFHECAWEALEHSGINPGTYEGLIGVYAGASNNFYWEILTNMSQRGNDLGICAAAHLTDKDFLSTRISYKLNLRGPSVSVQTACSTSLVAVHLACQGILNGECDVALAGGVTIYIYPEGPGYLYEEGNIMSPDGHCRAFDLEAKGAAAGNGVGIVVLKALADARRDGHYIHAIIKASAMNNDGLDKANYTAPSKIGQANVIRLAHELAEVNPETITYIEAHGTGTTIGDPIEIEALKHAFNTTRKKFCRIGSVKTNIGHLDSAAGIAGFIKTVLALKHRQIPPSINYHNPNPKIDFENSPFYVNQRLTQWDNGQIPLRAGVSSFGVGGTNVHVVLEEWPAHRNTEPVTPDQEPREQMPGKEYRLILLSAHSRKSLEQAGKNLARHFKNNPHLNLADAAYTLQVGRKAFKHRQMLVCPSVEEAAAALSEHDPAKIHSFTAVNDNRKIFFMFPGQGSQYVNMGLELYQTEPIFRKEMDCCFEIVHTLTDYDIKETLYPASRQNRSNGSNRSYTTYKSDIHQTEITQPVIFVIEYALAKLLMAWGFQPDAMIGHSIGEYTAACLAGVFSLPEALQIVVDRAKLMQKMPPGAMLSVTLPENRLIPLLTEDISLAGINSTQLCVVSGPHDAIENFQKKMNEKNIETTRLHTSHAFHSFMMDPVPGLLQDRLGKITFNKPVIPFISNVTGRWITYKQCQDPGYWAKHLKEPVRFSDGLGQLLKEQNAIFLEVGPGKTLGTFIQRHKHKVPEQKIINLIRHPKENVSDVYHLLKQLGHVWLYGKELDWPALYGPGKRHRLPLPTYSFDSQPYHIDNTLDHIRWNKSKGESGELERKPDMADWFYVPSWEKSIYPSGKPGEKVETPKRSGWLIFGDAMGLGMQVAQQLKQQGEPVIYVRKGPVYAREGDIGFIINPTQQRHYETLFEELNSLGKLPGRILHMWGVTADSSGTSLIDTLDLTLESGLYSMINIVQAMGKLNLTDNVQILVVTTNMQEVTGEETLDPGKAAVLGAVKVIPLEYPNIRCRSIDILLPEPGSSQEALIIHHLLQEFHIPAPACIVAFRGKHRWTRVVKPVRLDETSEINPRLKHNGVYLITGGLGGLGFTLARHLAKTFKPRLVLIGRSPFPPREEWENHLDNHDRDHPISRKIQAIREMERLGATIMTISADVSHLSQMEAAIHRVITEFGPINGLIHAAGLIDYAGIIQRRNREMNEAVMAPKIRGTLVLEQVLQDQPLDFMVLFSSIGNYLYKIKFGQVGHNAANEFVDAFAYARNQKNKPFVTTINWTDWLEVGMSVKAARDRGEGTHDLETQIVQSGSITPAEGIRLFQRIIAGTLPQVIVFPLDFYSSEERLNHLVDLGKSPQKTEKQTRPAGTAYKRPELSTAYVEPRDELERLLVSIWQEYFNFETVGIYDNFFELGGDSLKGMQFINRYRDIFGDIIHVNLIFDAPTAAELARRFRKIFPGTTARIMEGKPTAKADENKLQTDHEKGVKHPDDFTPIPTAPQKDYYKLSTSQKRFYLLQQKEPDTTVYNITQVFLLKGRMQKDKLEKAMVQLVERHRSLRSSFPIKDGEPVLKIHEPGEIGEISIACFETAGGKEQEHRIIDDFIKPYHLDKPPLFRNALIKTGDETFILIIDIHHIITDETSQLVLILEWIALYYGAELAPVKLHYIDYLEWYNSEEHRNSIKKQEAYWLKELGGDIPVLNLPSDYPTRPSQKGFGGFSEFFTIEREEVSALKRLAQKQEATLYMILLAAYYLLLAKLCGQEDIIISNLISGRDHVTVEQIVGLFVNKLVLRGHLSPGKTFREFLKETKEKLLKAYENQEYPFSELVDKLTKEKYKITGTHPFFEAFLVFQNENINVTTDGIHFAQSGDFMVESYVYEGKIAEYDLLLMGREEAGELIFFIKFNLALFKRETIQRWVNYFKEIVSFLIRNEDFHLADVTGSHGSIDF
jgi:iturin family lipopeptide synthetase A